MLQNHIVKSINYESKATKARLPYAIKRYATDGRKIPLKKNWSETWCTLPVYCDKIINEILHFELRNDDVFVVTFMKSGTTWMQECGWLLLNNLDFAKSKESCVLERSPFIEFKGIAPDIPGISNPLDWCQQLSSPRLFKTHMPANLLPLEIWEKKQKIIYVARNVKDVIVSSFHFAKGRNLWHGKSLEEFVEDFLNNEIIYTHYWSHVLDFWQMRHEPFIFFVTYEEMQRDLADVLQRLCNFLERPQLSAEELEKCLNHLSFESMKKNKSTNLTYLHKEKLSSTNEDYQFMRRGIVGSFKDELTPELISKIDKWTDDYLGRYGIREQDIFGEL